MARDSDGVYRLIRGRLYLDTFAGSRKRILSFCIEEWDWPGPVAVLVTVEVGTPKP